MTQGEAPDGTPIVPELDDDDAELDQDEDAGTPAPSDDEDLQSPPLDVDELPAH